MSRFVISDTHFHHGNIIKYCDRPFSSSEEMNESMIESWNSVVTERDEVFHLGDFSFSKKREDAEEVFKRLNGKKHLVVGNHDPDFVRSLGWETVSQYLELRVKKKTIVLFHYPILSWNKKFYGSLHLFGHVHGAPLNLGVSAMDVGVDSVGYIPLDLDKTVEEMRAQLEELRA